MLGHISNYLSYRRKNIRLAWSYADMSAVLDTLFRWAGYVVFTLMILYMISEKANAVSDAADNRAAAKLSAQAKRIEVLESFLDRCLQRGDHPIWIDDALHFCGMTDTGIRR